MNQVPVSQVPPVRTSTTAVISLVFGILAWFGLPLIGAVVAVICGHAARAEILASGGSLQGGGLALGGLILGWTHLILLFAIGALIFALPVAIFHGLDWSHWLEHWQDCNGTSA